MNKKLSEAHGIIQFLVNANSRLKLLAFISAIFLGLFTLPWTGTSLLIFLLGEFLIGFILVLSNSYFVQYDFGKKKEEILLNEAVNQVYSELPESPPNFSFLLMRHSLSLVGIGLVVALLWGGLVFNFTPWLSSVLVNAGEGSEAYRSMRYVVSLLFIIPSLPLTMSALVFIPRWLDLYVLRHESILKVYYKPQDDKPIRPGAFAKGVLRILGIGVALVVLVALQVLLEVADEKDWFQLLPTWVMIIGVTLPFVGIWYLLRSLDKPKEMVAREKEAAIHQAFGADSPEMAEFQSMKRSANSIELQKSSNKLRRLVLGIGAALSFILLTNVGIAFLPPVFTIPLAVLSLIAIPVGGIAALVHFSRSDDVKLPEDFALLEEALKRGDYETARNHANQLLETFPPLEANFVAARAYAMAGELAKAEALCREALKLILALEESNRDKVRVGQYLSLLGAVLINAGRFQEAEEFLYQGVKLENQQASFYNNLAQSLLMQNLSPELALEYLEKALETSSNEVQEANSTRLVPRMLKAWALSRTGKREAAYQLMQDTFAESDKSNVPLEAELHYYAAYIALSHGDKDKAKASFQHIVATDPNGLYAQLSRKML